MRRLAYALLLCLCTTRTDAQSPPVTPASPGAQTPARVIRNVGAPRAIVVNDTTRFISPTLVRAAADRAYIFDYNDGSVRAFALQSGALLWKSGKFGSTEGEFGSPTSLEIAPDSSIWVNDPQQGRITILSRDGALVRIIRIGQPFEKIVVRTRSSFIGVDLSRINMFAAAFDRTGKPLRALDPPPGYADLTPLARAVLAEPTPAGIAVAFGYTGRIVGVSDAPGQAPGEAPVTYNAVEVRPSLRDTVITTAQGWHVRQPNPNAVLVVRYLSVCDGLLYALAGAEPGKEGHYVDVYDTKTGAYKYTWLLPVEAGAMDVTRDGIVTLQAVNEKPAMIFYPFPVNATRTGKK